MQLTLDSDSRCEFGVCKSFTVVFEPPVVQIYEDDPIDVFINGELMAAGGISNHRRNCPPWWKSQAENFMGRAAFCITEALHFLLEKQLRKRCN